MMRPEWQVDIPTECWSSYYQTHVNADNFESSPVGRSEALIHFLTGVNPPRRLMVECTLQRGRQH